MRARRDGNHHAFALSERRLRVDDMNRVAICLAAGAVALMPAGPLTAQVVTPIPSLNSDAAKTAAEACIAMATKNDWRVSVTVVDAAGNMLYMRRMDGAPILSVEPTRMKAETAL